MTSLGLPDIGSAIPGPNSTAAVDVLARYECPAITARRARRANAMGLSDVDPIVWETARSANVWDVDGNRFVDLTSGFGVATVGHRDPRVVAAAHAQTDRLLHAMGDAYPDLQRIRLLEELASLTPDGLDHAILGLSGADAIDALVKTAILATGRVDVLVFEGSYHGLSLGSVALQAYKPAFTDPFRGIVHPAVHVLPYGASREDMARAIKTHDIGLVLVEPIQGRGGIRVAPSGWLEAVNDVAHRHGAVVGHDEIQCGLARTGSVLAADVVPDLLALGKALGGGFPISACIGNTTTMGAWGASRGEAIHTQTFLGHPVGCATARAVLAQMNTLPERCADRGRRWVDVLTTAGFETQGRGLMLGIKIPSAITASRALLERGYIILPAGMQAEVLALTPPVTVSNEQMDGFVQALVEVT